MAENGMIRGDKNWRLDHIDMLRGWAALSVMAGHLRSHIFMDYGSLSEPGIKPTLFME
jgi:peptidoglycan/LPS O-acetylase OafA/YrhL